MTADELDAAIETAKGDAGDWYVGGASKELVEALTELRTARNMLEQCWWRKGYNEKGYCPFCLVEAAGGDGPVKHTTDCKLVKLLGWK